MFIGPDFNGDIDIDMPKGSVDLPDVKVEGDVNVTLPSADIDVSGPKVGLILHL